MEPVSEETSGGSSSKHADDSTHKSVKHNPRKRATPPGFGVIKEEAFDPEAGAPPGTNPRRPAELPAERSSEQALHAQAILDESRIGPHVVRYANFALLGGIVYTYLNGFLHLYQNNRPKYVQTFQHRVWIVGPMLAMYATANNILPFPFKANIEAFVGRQALSMVDLLSAERYLQAEDEYMAAPMKHVNTEYATAK